MAPDNSQRLMPAIVLVFAAVALAGCLGGDDKAKPAAGADDETPSTAGDEAPERPRPTIVVYYVNQTAPGPPAPEPEPVPAPGPDPDCLVGLLGIRIGCRA